MIFGADRHISAAPACVFDQSEAVNFRRGFAEAKDHFAVCVLLASSLVPTSATRFASKFLEVFGIVR